MVKLAEILVKTNKIVKVSPSETLSSTLSKLSTSHDAAFVFSQDGTYLGIINPYHCLIKSSYPGNTKVEHCLFHAPRIHTNDKASKVARQFIESKVHYLPVFDPEERFIGIVSARHLLAIYKNDPVFKRTIADALKMKNKRLVTVREEDNVATAVNIFKKEKISKLIVAGRDGKLKGVLSYYDLIAYLVAPKDSHERGDRAKTKINFYHQKIKNFAKLYVLTLKREDLLERAVHLILEKKIGSVVVVGENRYPIGIITTKDLLTFLLNGENGKRIELISKNLSEQSRRIVGGFFNHLTLWMRKIPELTKARLLVQEEKEGNLFKVVLSLFPKKGEPKVFEKEGRNLFKVLKKIKKN